MQSSPAFTNSLYPHPPHRRLRVVSCSFILSGSHSGSCRSTNDCGGGDGKQPSRREHHRGVLLAPILVQLWKELPSESRGGKQATYHFICAKNSSSTPPPHSFVRRAK